MAFYTVADLYKMSDRYWVDDSDEIGTPRPMLVVQHLHIGYHGLEMAITLPNWMCIYHNQEQV